MLKKISLIIICIIVIVGVGYTLMPKEGKNKVENIVSSIGENSKPNTKVEKLTLLANGKTNHSNRGYYYINIAGDRKNIKYFDYAAKKEIYLCNKPNCKHNTKDCNSYLEIIDENEVFSYDNKLYLISSAAVADEMEAGESSNFGMVTVNQTAQNIYKMNLDGTDKTKVFECPSGNKMIPCAIEGNAIYAFFTKTKSIAIGTNTTTQMETERKLVKINLETGKYEEICDSKNKNILGVYKNSIVLEEIEYKEDPEKFLKNNSGAINNINNSTKKIKLFDLDTKQETQIYQDIYKNMETIVFGGNKVCFIGSKSKKIEFVNIETKEKGTLIDLPKTGATFEGIYDNKLQYLYYDKSSNEAKVDKAYCIDIETGENKEFNLLNNTGALVQILAENEVYYFVTTGSEMTEEYTTWAGTKQRDIIKINYGLIQKEDYWNSKANYISMKNTEN